MCLATPSTRTPGDVSNVGRLADQEPQGMAQAALEQR